MTKKAGGGLAQQALQVFFDYHKWSQYPITLFLEVLTFSLEAAKRPLHPTIVVGSQYRQFANCFGWLTNPTTLGKYRKVPGVAQNPFCDFGPDFLVMQIVLLCILKSIQLALGGVRGCKPCHFEAYHSCAVPKCPLLPF